MGGVGTFCCSWEAEVDEDDVDFFFMKELKKPVLRSRVKVPASWASSSGPPGDLSRGCCLRGRAGEQPDRTSTPSTVETTPRSRRPQGGVSRQICRALFRLREKFTVHLGFIAG